MTDISKSKKWTLEKLTEIAKKYRFKYDFAKQDIAAYTAAKRYGVFEQITSHMESHKNTIKQSKPQEEVALKNKDYICNSYKSRTMSIANLALELKISRRAVKEILLANGVEVRAQRGGMPVKDLKDKIFGNLTAIKRAPNSNKTGHTIQWFCDCKCGKEGNRIKHRLAHRHCQKLRVPMGFNNKTRQT